MPIEIDAIQTVKSIGWTDALLSRLAANSVGLGARLSITAPANASALSSTGYSLTGSNAQSMIDLAGTLNTTGSPAIIKVAMSNTASGATTKFLSLLAGASGTTEVLSIDKSGVMLAANTANAFGDILETNSGFGFSYGDPLIQKAGTSIASALSSGWQVLALTFGASIGSPDIFVRRDAANTLALRNAANAQAFNVYNTYTSGSVYERGFMRWVSNVLEIGTEHVGASARRISFKVNAFEYMTIGTSTVDFGSDVNFATASSWRFSARSGMASPSDGVLVIRNNASTDFNRLQFGGTTSSFPALKRSTTALQVRLADDSAFAPFAASTLALTAPTDSSVLSSTGYSLTGSNAQSMIDLAGTWNTSGTPTLIKANVTNTASNASSLLIDLQVGGSSMFRVDRGGLVTSPYLLATSYVTSPNIFSQSNSGGIYLGAANDIALRWDAANTLALRNAANAQAFNIYNTYTSGSVFERGFIKWESSQLRIGTEHVGANSRPIMFLVSGGIKMFIDNLSNLICIGGTATSATPALKPSSTILQVRLGDDSDFAPLQGKLRVHANAATETIIPDKTLLLYDAAGTAYKVPCVAA